MTIIIWKCALCNSIQISNSKLTHQMDFCKCDCTGLDLEDGYSRGSFKNSPEDIIELKRIEHDDYYVWKELTICCVEQEFVEFEDIVYSMFGVVKPRPQISLKNKDNFKVIKQIEKEVLLSFIK